MTGTWVRGAALVCLIVVGFTGCLRRDAEPEPQDTSDTTPQPTVSDLTTLPPSSFDQELATHLEQATEAATTWKEDALLTYVSVELPASLVPNSGNEVYVFGSAGDVENWYTYSIAQETGKFVRAIIPKEDFLGRDLEPINQEFWTMNYVEALQLAELNGGFDFRTTNPGTTATTFLSHRAPRNWLWWTVEYTAPTGQQLTLLVNPFRGEVVDETGTEIAPPGGLPTPSTNSSTTPAADDTL